MENFFTKNIAMKIKGSRENEGQTGMSKMSLLLLLLLFTKMIIKYSVRLNLIINDNISDSVLNDYLDQLESAMNELGKIFQKK